MLVFDQTKIFVEAPTIYKSGFLHGLGEILTVWEFKLNVCIANPTSEINVDVKTADWKVKLLTV